jgi:hypothetical protein
MYLDSLKWQPLDGEWAFRELVKLLSVSEAEARARLEVSASEAELSFYAHSTLVRFDVRSDAAEFDPVLALHVPQNSEWPAAEAGPELLLLDGLSAPIHDANARACISLTRDTVADYVRFFCFFVRGAEGAFNLLEQPPSGPPVPEGARAAVRPITVEPDLDPAGRFRLKACVDYNRAFFEAEFVVMPADGAIEMVDDRPLADHAPSDRDLRITDLTVLSEIRKVHLSRKWARASDGEIVPIRAAWKELEQLSGAGGLGDTDWVGVHWGRLDWQHVTVERRVQVFLRATEIVRITYVPDGKPMERQTSLFLLQHLDPTLPTLWPIGRRAANLRRYLRGLGPNIAQHVPGAWQDYAAFAVAESLEFESGPEEFQSYLSFSDLPLQLAERVCEAIGLWRGESAGLASLLADANQVLDGRTEDPAMRELADRIGYLTCWLRALDADAPAARQAPASAPTPDLERRVMTDLEKRFKEHKWKAAVLCHARKARHTALEKRRPILWDKLTAAELALSAFIAEWTKEHGKQEDPGLPFEAYVDPKQDKRTVGMFVCRTDAGASHLAAVKVALGGAQHWGVSREEQVDLSSWKSSTATPQLQAPDLSGLRDDIVRQMFASALQGPQPSTVISVEEAVHRLVWTSELHDVTVEGNLRLDRLCNAGIRSLKGVRLENCHIKGTLRLDGLHIEQDFFLQNVTVSGRICADRATIGNELHFDHVSVFWPDAASSEACEGVSFSLDGTVIDGRLFLNGCCFEGKAVFKLMRADWMLLSSVRVKGFEGDRIETRSGSLMVNSDPGTAFSPAYPYGAVTLDNPFGMVCEDGFSLRGATIKGSLNLIGVSIRGLMNIFDVEIRERLMIGYSTSVQSCIEDLWLRTTRIAGDLLIQNCLVKDVAFVYRIAAAGLRFGAPHDPGGAHRHETIVGGDLRLYECTASATASSAGIEVLGALLMERCDLGAVDIDGRLAAPAYETASARKAFLVPSTIGKGVTIRSCEIAGGVQIVATQIRRSTDVRPALEIATSTIGQDLAFWSGRYCEKGAGFLIAEHASPQEVPEVDEWSNVSHQQPRDDLADAFPLAGWPVRYVDPDKKPPMERPGRPVNLSERDQALLEASRSARHVKTVIDGGVRINQCQLGGDVRLNNLQADGQRVELTNVSVMGNVRSERGDRRNRELANPENAKGSDLRTVCGSLALDHCRIEGSVDLVGLHVGETSLPPGGQAAVPNGEPTVLSIRNTAITQGLSLVDRRPTRPPGHRPTAPALFLLHARLFGGLDISGSTFGTVRVGGAHWSEASGERAKNASARSPLCREVESLIGRLMSSMRDIKTAVPELASSLWNEGSTAAPLARVRGTGATVRKLEFVCDAVGSANFGVPTTDLTDASVVTWSPESSVGGAANSNDLPPFFAQLLSGTAFREKLYQQIESYLDGAGQEEDSKKIRRDFVWRRRCEQLTATLPDCEKAKQALGCAELVASSTDRYRVQRALKVIALCVFAFVAVGVAFPRSIARRSSLLDLWRFVTWPLTLLPVLLLLVPAELLARANLLGLQKVVTEHEWVLGLGLLPPLTLPEVRALAGVWGSALNRMLSGNFTSWARALLWWVALYGFAIFFFWDVDHLDVNSLYKKSFYEAQSVAAEPSDSPDAPCSEWFPPWAEPNKVTADVCETAAHWDWRHAALLAVRYMIPVAPAIYDEIDIDNSFVGAERTLDGEPSEEFKCALQPRNSLPGRCCESVGWFWRPSGNREFELLHQSNAAFVAVLIRVLSSILLTLFTATIGLQLSRKPSAE